MDETQGQEPPPVMDSPPADESPELPPLDPPAELPAEPPAAAPVEGEAAAAAAPAEEFAAARQVFADRCQRCHNIGGEELAGGPEGPAPGDGGGFGGPGRGGPGGRGMRGPDLSHIGASPEKTVAWIADHIRDPKSHNDRSRMPAFAEQLSDDEIVGLAELLASLR